MLILTRKPRERIFIRVPGVEKPITITLVDMRRDGKCRIGIEASREIDVDREEVFASKTAPAA